MDGILSIIREEDYVVAVEDVGVWFQKLEVDWEAPSLSCVANDTRNILKDGLNLLALAPALRSPHSAYFP